MIMTEDTVSKLWLGQFTEWQWNVCTSTQYYKSYNTMYLCLNIKSTSENKHFLVFQKLKTRNNYLQREKKGYLHWHVRDKKENWILIITLSSLSPLEVFRLKYVIHQ